MDYTKLSHLINLLNVPKIGPKRVHSLITDHKDIESIFTLSESALCQTDGIDLRLAKEIKAYSNFDHGCIELESAEKAGARIISYLDDKYPILLKNTHNPPIVLYVKGQNLNPKEDCIAIVGSRITTDYGRSVTQSLVKDILSNGITIVSGLARGIDTIAHNETIKNNGRTIAVLGCGIDITYPSENKKLFQEITEKGTIISEFPVKTLPESGNFPQRNRIISGLSHGTVVIEAGNRSGAILTAFNAIDQNREVFAVPGRIYDKQSVGCLRLIKHGAIPVESGQQLIETIQPKLFSPQTPKQSALPLDISNEEKIVLEHLSGEPIHIDTLTRNTKHDLTHLLAILLQLELKGIVKQISGKQFIRIL